MLFIECQSRRHILQSFEGSRALHIVKVKHNFSVVTVNRQISHLMEVCNCRASLQRSGQLFSTSIYSFISLCLCLDKLLESMRQVQFILKQWNKLCNRPHGFARGRSTVTNALTCDKIIVDVILAAHHYDILSFDLKAAFDKAPLLCHWGFFAMVITRTPLRWFACYLTSRTQQVRIENSLPVVALVVSGVIQEFRLGPGIYTVLADTQLKRVNIPVLALADNLKFVVDVKKHCCA